MITELAFAYDPEVVLRRECHPKLRDTNVEDFGKALVQPLINLQTQFKAQRLENLAKLRSVHSVCQLRKLLNDKFDSILRRIYITNVLDVNDLAIIFGANSLQQGGLIYSNPVKRPWMMRIDSVTTAETGVDFVVFIPADLDNEDAKDGITELVEKYKLLTSTWKFELI